VGFYQSREATWVLPREKNPVEFYSERRRPQYSLSLWERARVREDEV